MTSAQSEWQGLVVHGLFPMTWLAYARERGLPAAELAQRAGLEGGDVSSYPAGVPLVSLHRLISEVLATLGDDGIGIEIGWRLPLTAYGSLGHAMLASATLGEALFTCQRYWQLIARNMSVSIATHGDICVCTLASRLDVAEPFRHIMFESVLASIHRGLCGLAPQAASSLEVWFDTPEPAHATLIRSRLPGVRFAMPMVQIRLPAALLDTPLVMASDAGRRVAIEQCEAEVRALRTQGRLTQRVQKRLGLGAGGYPTLEDMAGQIGMSARTLRRHLADEGSGYSQLLEEARQRDALRLLDTTLEIADVAERLGYTDAANFTRAFRKWSGMAPSQYRQRAGRP